MSRLTEDERKTLLRIARDSIAAKLRGQRGDPPEPPSPSLRQPVGAFVTLHKGRALRGCIGTFESRTPLYRTVHEMARSAAFGDPRFAPLAADELPEVDLEISVLTPMRRVQDLSEIQVGRHGLYVIMGFSRGVLLPQVATDYGWDRDTFLSETCRKAGLPRDAWKKGAEVHSFEAEVFGEREGSGS